MRATGSTASDNEPKVRDAKRSEQDAKTAVFLYECRNAARFILGDKYFATIGQWRHVVEEQRRQTGDSILEAAIHLGQNTTASEPTVVLLIMAAAVEMIEQPGSVGAVDPADGRDHRLTTRDKASS